MLARELIQPRSMVVVGGSNNLYKPGGKVIQNLLRGTYDGHLHIVNPGEKTIQGIPCHASLEDLPEVELAILAIAARSCPETVRYLAENKQTRGFIILSAGFAEESREGAVLEKEIRKIVDAVGGSLIGPNCIGVMNAHYQGVFTTPVPELDPGGCDFISGSGATAVFIMEAGIPNGLRFSSVYSVGNSAQVGVEEVLQHLDETFDPASSSRVIVLYLETINHPDILLRHASSLVSKGCRIAAIKSGVTEAGSRAASSHTGAMAGSDMAAGALLRKAGIVRCSSREELVAVASVFMHRELTGGRLAIITHAGGPAVMLTDTLSEGGMEVPRIKHPKAAELLEELHPGSSASNPIDILATGTAGQLGKALDYCDRYFGEVDGMVVIFGSPGLFNVGEAYRILDEKMNTCRKPVFPVLPSLINAGKEIREFLAMGRVNFPDEVRFGRALCKVYHNRGFPLNLSLPEMDVNTIKRVIGEAGDGYLAPEVAGRILDASGIKRIREEIAERPEEAIRIAQNIGFPVAMKALGPLHKSDVGGVALNVQDPGSVSERFEDIMHIRGTRAVLIQAMQPGMELYAGIKREGEFGHLILCGMGGIFVEALKDVAAGLAPLSEQEADYMIRSLRAYPLIRGARGMPGIREDAFRQVLLRLSALAVSVPGITEMDLNPLMADAKGIHAVDARIRIDT